MRPRYFIVLFMLLVSFLTGCNPPAEPPVEMGRLPFSSDALPAHYEDARQQLGRAGFTNIQCEAVTAPSFGFLFREGEIESIWINGNPAFVRQEMVPLDADITIRYYQLS